MAHSNNNEFRAYFSCFNGCEGEYPLDEVIYRCPKCGSLLEVTHDMERLKRLSAAQWRERFDSRLGTARWPYGSGVWRYKEWVLPEVDDENIVSMYEGNTNLFWAKHFGEKTGVKDLWIKMCGNSHTGSFKDLGMTVLVSMVNEMRARGKNIRAVACASTGDTSAALSAFAAYAQIPSIVFLPANKISTAQLVQPMSNNAIVLSIDSDFDGCMKIVQEVTKDSGLYLANSMNSLRIEGQKTIAPEIVQQFEMEVPDTIIIPGGNLGNVSALGKGFDMMYELGLITRLPRIVVAQAQNANPLYLAYCAGFENFAPVTAKKTLASAIQIGDPVSVSKAIATLKRYNGVVVQASEEELADAAALSDRYGMYTCPHTGVAIAGYLKLVENKTISADERVVIISTAHGLKFSEFKVGYHDGTLNGVKSRYQNRPISIGADADAVKQIINRVLADKIK